LIEYMATPEKKVKDRAKRILDKLGAYHFSPATGYGGRRGIPDIIACYQGVFIGIECKAGKNKPTKLQEYELKKIEDAGGLTLVFTDSTKAEELEELLLGEEKKDMTHWALQNIS